MVLGDAVVALALDSSRNAGARAHAWTADRSSRRIITTRDLALAFSPTERQATDPVNSSAVHMIADARLRVELSLAGQRVTRASCRSSVIGRRLCGAHNSAIPGSHANTVDPTTATVALL